MEDSPLFNAGRGAVFAGNGTQEMDASVMWGADHSCGAVAAVRTFRNPIRAANRVRTHSPHVLMVDSGAEAWGAAEGLDTAPPEWFFDADRWEHFQRARAAGIQALDHELDDEPKGTVGAVALDADGHLAAATSTGGMANKLPGRVGDSAIIGAGTWASDSTAAISTTGTGEAFIRAHAAGRVHDLMCLAHLSLEQACQQVVFDEVPAVGGLGGLIAVGRDGVITMPFGSGGMYRGALYADGRTEVAIW